MASEPREPAHHTSSNNWDGGESRLRHRLPWHLLRRPNDIYLDANSDYKAEKNRGLTELGQAGWLVVHGLGASMPQAITLALSIQATLCSPTTLHTNTSTVFLSDDLQSSYGGREQESQMKGYPSVHIKISLQQPSSKDSN